MQTGSDAFFRQLFVNDVPLLDVRAPIEFSAGAFPTARNWPLLDDEQRQQIGLMYKQQGQDKAIELGWQMATPEVLQHRLDGWQAFIRQNPNGYLYCFRGGLRSRTSQQCLRDAGIDYPKIDGGYKAMRRFLLAELERLAQAGNLLVVAGATACGKTDLLGRWPHSIDLEARARHRGSAFGTRFAAQPAQIDFENALAVDWLKLEEQSAAVVLIEAESRLIGRLNLPPFLQAAMKAAPHIELHASREQRLQRLRNDYIAHALQNFQAHSQDPWLELHNYINDALQRIKKRLGGVHYAELQRLLPQALQLYREQQQWDGFDQMFSLLLDHYYDRMYAYQLEKQSQQIVFSGDQDEVLHWLHHDFADGRQAEARSG